MNLYLNESQKNIFKALLDYPSLQVLNDFEDAEQLIQELKSKVNKKKIDKKAKLPSATFYDIHNRELSFSPCKDNKAIIIKANKSNFPAKYGGHFNFEWNIETLIEIANYLHNYSIFTGDNDYNVYQTAYVEEFNVFKDEVERSINVSGSTLSFICYTGDETDDDWSYLLPNRVKEYLRIIVAYIFLRNDIEFHFSKLHPSIQDKHSAWVVERSKQQASR